MSTNRKAPSVGVRILPNGNVWLVCKERGVGILAGSRSQGLHDMKAQLNEEFTIRTIDTGEGGQARRG